MDYNIKIEKFEGPLDLLLQLIDKQELSITDISLAAVADQYLSYIEANIDVNPEEMVDFLVVATKLLLLKSRLLLPEEEVDEEEIDLSNQLKIYKDFLDASKMIEEMVASKKFLYSREISPIKMQKVFSPPQDTSTEDLRELFSRVLNRLEPLFLLPQSVMEKTITLQDKIGQIKNILSSRKEISFDVLIKAAQTRTEVIIGFLALLELIKQREVDVLQDDNFSEIVIKKK